MEQQATQAGPPLLRMEHISKSFSGVHALRDVQLEVRAGEVHALMGENGAGKSTLMKILSGIYKPDAGSIKVDGEPAEISGPDQARALGISIIHQELNLSPNLSVAENIYMGREPRSRFGLIDFRRMEADAARVLKEVGAAFSPATLVGTLSTGPQQLVEIAKSLSQNAHLLIMDEPTAALSERESQKLFEIIRALRGRGIAIIYISHRMAEVYALADRVTVLRDGQYVATRDRAELTPDELIRLMVGRPLDDLFAREPAAAGDAALEVRGLTDGGFLQPCSLTLRRGEVVGLAGLIGAGRTELARLIFGADRSRAGEILVEGRPVAIRQPRDAIRAGIGLVPESRKEQGLFLQMAVGENIVIADLPELSSGGIISRVRARRTANEQVRSLHIKAASLDLGVGSLSGGNQQKVVLAKWLTLRPKVLILDEPTRGVDVGAKAEIYRIISRLAQEGVAILMISSELPEVLGMSDRILVMHEGRIAGELPGGAAQEDVMTYAAGRGGRAAAAV